LYHIYHFESISPRIFLVDGKRISASITNDKMRNYDPSAKIRSNRSIVYDILTIMTVLAVCMWAVISYHWDFKYTFSEPFDAPGQLVSERNGPVYWVLLPISVTRIVLLVAATARSANNGSRAFRFIVALCALLNLFAEISGIVIFFIEREGCNAPPDGDPSGIGNVCNSELYCAVYGTNNVTCFPTNQTLETFCPLTLAPYFPPVTVDDLKDKWVFDATLGTEFIFAFLSIMHILIGNWMGDGTDADVYDYDDAYTGNGNENFTVSSKFDGSGYADVSIVGNPSGRRGMSKTKRRDAK
jgi:hypothetical protein